MSKRLSVLTNGLLKENPVLRLVLGTCPTIAITTMAMNAIGMGFAATFVLVGSNVVISALRKVIPDKVRIPCFIVIIAGFVTLLSSLLQAFFPSIYDQIFNIVIYNIFLFCYNRPVFFYYNSIHTTVFTTNN